MKELSLQVIMALITVCTYVSYVPQLYKLVKTKKSEDLSLMSWSIWTFSSSAYLVYSILLGRWELIVSCISEWVLIISTLVLTIHYNKKNKELKKQGV